MRSNEAQNHVVVVEAYDGVAEFLSSEFSERAATCGLGLPLEEIAEGLKSRITVLCWDEWIRWEQTGHSFFSWMPTPATRLRDLQKPLEVPSHSLSPVINWMEIPARDPDHGLPFDLAGLSPQSHGLLHNSDPLLLLSYCLSLELTSLFSIDPYGLVILPMYGGLGYISQLARATKIDSCIDVPFGVVVTDTSFNRQQKNQGIWTRQGVTRRQMEDLSLALADLSLVFGSRGVEIARQGSLAKSKEPTLVPRRVPTSLLRDIKEAGNRAINADAQKQIFLEEPQESASGVLLTLDAVMHNRKQGFRFDRPIISAGPDTIFAPMRPRGFVDYWSTRGFVRELITEHQWGWETERPNMEGTCGIRLYPSRFEHLPCIWNELAQGSCVFLSSAAAEGIAAGTKVPKECLLEEETEALASRLVQIACMDVAEHDRIRRKLCELVVQAQSGPERAQMLADAIRALKALLVSTPQHPSLGRVARLFLDRRIPLRIIDEKEEEKVKDRVELSPEPGNHKLSVIVTCYEMGPLLGESIRSIWAADRLPDEVLLIDDGSHGEPTLKIIRDLELEAVEGRLPLTIIRQNNQGLAAARNVGLWAAAGEFVSFLDGDDIMYPEFYRLAMRLLVENTDLGGMAAWTLCEGPGDQIGFWNDPQPELPFLFTQNTVFVPCMMRARLIRELGGYETQQRYNYEDWELSCRMLAAGFPIVTIPLYLQRYKVRQDSLFRTMTPVQNQVMREQFLGKHHETVSQFSVEIAMLTEHRLMQELDSHQKTNEGQPIKSDLAVLTRMARLAQSCIGAGWRWMKARKSSASKN